MEVSFACHNTIASKRAIGFVDYLTFVKVISMFNEDAVGVLRSIE